jgi:hypothetical protein
VAADDHEILMLISADDTGKIANSLPRLHHFGEARGSVPPDMEELLMAVKACLFDLSISS